MTSKDIEMLFGAEKMADRAPVWQTSQKPFWEPEQLISIDDLLRSAEFNEISEKLPDIGEIQEFDDLIHFDTEKKVKEEPEVVTREMTAAEIISRLFELQGVKVRQNVEPEISEQKIRRRLVNNQAALRCRLKRKQKLSESMKRIEIFESENPQLKKRLSDLNFELASLKRKLSVYRSLC